MPPEPEGISESEIVQYSLFIFILISYSVKVSDLRENYKKRSLERSLKWQAKLAIWRCLAEWGNRKALRLRAQGAYSCK